MSSGWGRGVVGVISMVLVTLLALIGFSEFIDAGNTNGGWFLFLGAVGNLFILWLTFGDYRS